MRNIKAMGLLVLALLTGLAAAVYAAGWVARQGSIASNKVVVANVDSPGWPPLDGSGHGRGAAGLCGL